MRRVPLTVFLSLSLAWVANWQEAVAAESKRLLLYSCFVESENAALFDAFSRDTGVEIRHVRLSAGEALARLAAEAGNPQVSLMLGGSVDAHLHAADAGLLDGYVSPNTRAVPEAFRDPSGIYTPVSVVVTALVANTRWLDENKLAPPRSWAELLGPAYEGNVSIAHPATSGAAYTAFSTILQLYGEEEGFSYLRRLDRNITQYTKAGAAPMRMVGLGEAGVAIGYDLDGAALLDQGYPLVITYPEEGTGYEVTCASLVKGGPAEDAANARRFLDWLLEVKTQEMLGRQFFRIPVNRKVETPDTVTPLERINTVDYDVVWSARNKGRLVERFEREVRGQAGAR